MQAETNGEIHPIGEPAPHIHVLTEEELEAEIRERIQHPLASASSSVMIAEDSSRINLICEISVAKRSYIGDGEMDDETLRMKARDVMTKEFGVNFSVPNSRVDKEDTQGRSTQTLTYRTNNPDLSIRETRIFERDKQPLYRWEAIAHNPLPEDVLPASLIDFAIHEAQNS